ncbi:hypothetical protein [Streptomyces leeuwenhoekii]|uniref:Integral Membrane Protein n=1 Tax=Streptomyces leeuwenhoekii TaxID=1437453 RepID=A0A0F7VVC4_STRLW|nr:hypothetical protein [Streptomyces leeuwenhoekii]CQR61487.1 Integral Membrane Protein [Streptomyces leeuwenhoekii]
MLALRLSRPAHLAVQARRLLVSAASAGTGFLLLCALGHALSHPDSPAASLSRLAWCAAPLAATVYLAVAVARTDPATRPRPGLSAIGLGPGRLMAISAASTALSCALGSVLALLSFLHLRGDLSGLPLDGSGGDGGDVLAAGLPLPFPAALTLLAIVPATASAAVALALRPRDPRPGPATARRYGRFGAYGLGAARETFGAYGRFGAHRRTRGAASAQPGTSETTGRRTPAAVIAGAAAVSVPRTVVTATAPEAASRAARAAAAPGARTEDTAADAAPGSPAALPWGVTLLAAGLAVETYASRTAPGSATPAAGVLAGWVLTALGLALAGPGLTHLCGRLLQSARPGALRLLAGRLLMEEAGRIGRPLGVVCAVASAAHAAATLSAGRPAFGPLGTLGALVVAGCTVATLLTAAVETRQARSDTRAALRRLGAPGTTLRAAAALRAAALLALFGPVTLAVAELAALPLARS